MKLKNRVQLIGNLGSAPSVKKFESGKKLARFNVATDELIKRKGKYEKITHWVNVSAWGKNADIAEQFLETGSEVIIEGRLISTNFTDRNGNTRRISEVMADSILYRNIKNEIENHNKENVKNNLRA